MKHISESIIGKRGGGNKLYNTRLGLRQGDIVYIYNSTAPYMYIADQELIKKALPSAPARYDMSDGIVLRYDYTDLPHFMVMSDYNDDLILKDDVAIHPEGYTVSAIWRSKKIFTQPKTLHELMSLCLESNIEALISGNYYKKIK